MFCGRMEIGGDADKVSLRLFLDNKHDEVTQLIEFVVNRSHGSMTSIKFFDFVDVDDLLLISQRCPGLEHFKIHMYYSNLPKLLFGKETVCVAISNLKELEGMDVQNEFIDETILEQIDEFCPNFTKLKIAGRVQENTATLISKSLPKLRVLDISGTRIGRLALLVILKGCKELEHLDVSRCSPDWGRYRPLSEVIDGDDEIRKSAYHLKVFKWK
ncbi:hypothetical protein IFM89_001789 [Coptis chinensis]|uniref:Uncharacterized protein n=1 Tax=Coptis chinensis TaxID=261450 RepID=A0A835LLB9_9MAGN|nr:hypothetical protein IFM89_001789 [Coptis chinensis]